MIHRMVLDSRATWETRLQLINFTKFVEKIFFILEFANQAIY